MWWSYKLLKADVLYRRDTPESIREAIRLRPEAAEYYLRLARLDEDKGNELLKKALALEPYNAEASIEFALNLEAEGNTGEAEKLLLKAYQADRTYLSRWSLANFYFRRSDFDKFWYWARKAAEMPSADIAPLFELCWRVTPDAGEIGRRVMTDDPSTIRQFLGFLSAKKDIEAGGDAARRLIEHGEAQRDRDLLLGVINHMIEAGDVKDSTGLWTEMIARQWVVADSGEPNNAAFARQPAPVEFDWSLPSYDGLHSWPGPAGLEAEFSGKQPENCVIAEQTLALGAGNYELHFRYRTKDMESGTGLTWSVSDRESNKELARSAELLSDSLKDQSLRWSVPSGTPLVRLRLEYHRPLGSPRISGLLVVESTKVQ
jgi:tetratricopeptide (TPR) repeat protein